MPTQFSEDSNTNRPSERLNCFITNLGKRSPDFKSKSQSCLDKNIQFYL